MDAKMTRSDAWGENLSEADKWSLYRWTKEPKETEDGPKRKSYEDALEYIGAELRVMAPSRPAWYRFLARMRREEKVQQIARIAGNCETAKDMTAEAKTNNRLAADAFRALALDAAMDDDPKSASLYKSAAVMFQKIDLDERAQRIKDEQLALATKKFEDEQTRRTAAEARAEKAEAEAEALKKRISELETALHDAGKANIADPEKVAAEMDKLLGRKK